jgi:hypothetical protein
MHKTQKQTEILLAAQQNILYSAARVQTLRDDGRDIKTIRRREDTGQKTTFSWPEMFFVPDGSHD